MFLASFLGTVVVTLHCLVLLAWRLRVHLESELAQSTQAQHDQLHRPFAEPSTRFLQGDVGNSRPGSLEADDRSFSGTAQTKAA
jgi:hypothetical protein